SVGARQRKLGDLDGIIIELPGYKSEGSKRVSIPEDVSVCGGAADGVNAIGQHESDNTEVELPWDASIGCD
ncbi:hypothetical protein AX15_001237, partial [Amanita polypyramis BW_CC]